MVGVNKQTLLYYDKIHLFSPEYVDDMGYRYYTFTQLDCFYAIMTLKTIGMSLEEIKEYFDTRDAERTAKLLQKGILETKKKVAELVTLSREMNKRIELLEKANHVTCGKIYIEHHETQYLYCTKYISMDAKEIERQEIYGKMIGYRVLHQLHCGPAIGGMVENKFLMNPVGNTTLYCRYYTIVDEPCEEDTEDCEYLEKPEGNYLVLYYKGAYDTTYKAYSQILEYGRKHHFRLGEFSYEESFIDEVSENNPDNYVTQITVPFQFE